VSGQVQVNSADLVSHARQVKGIGDGLSAARQASATGGRIPRPTTRVTHRILKRQLATVSATSERT